MQYNNDDLDEDKDENEETNLNDLLSENGEINVEKLIQEFKKLEKKPKKSFKSFLVAVILFLITLVFTYFIYIASFGLLERLISFKNWQAVLIYFAGLTGINMFLSLIRLQKFKTSFLVKHTWVMRAFLFKPLITLVAMIIFNYSGQRYFNYDGFFDIVLFFLLSNSLIYLINYYRIKFLGR